MKKLKDIANITSGFQFRGAIKATYAGELRVIRLQDISVDGKLDDSSIIKTNLPLARSLSFLKNNDILFCATGPRNTCALFKSNKKFGKATATGQFHIIDIFSPDYSYDFICWFLNHADSQHFFSGAAEGDLMPHIPREVLEEVKLPDISRDKQQQILQLDELAKQLTCQLETTQKALITLALPTTQNRKQEVKNVSLTLENVFELTRDLIDGENEKILMNLLWKKPRDLESEDFLVLILNQVALLHEQQREDDQLSFTASKKITDQALKSRIQLLIDKNKHIDVQKPLTKAASILCVNPRLIVLLFNKLSATKIDLHDPTYTVGTVITNLLRPKSHNSFLNLKDTSSSGLVWLDTYNRISGASIKYTGFTHSALEHIAKFLAIESSTITEGVNEIYTSAYETNQRIRGRFDQAFVDLLIEQSLQKKTDCLDSFYEGSNKLKYDTYVQLQLIANSLKKGGVGCALLDESKLRSAGIEKEIRKQLIVEKKISTVILFPKQRYSLGNTHAAIIVFEKSREQDEILFIDTTQSHYDSLKNSEKLTSLSHRILNCVQNRSSIKRFSKLVPYKEISLSRFNLSPKRYVKNSVSAEGLQHSLEIIGTGLRQINRVYEQMREKVETE